MAVQKKLARKNVDGVCRSASMVRMMNHTDFAERPCWTRTSACARDTRRAPLAAVRRAAALDQNCPRREILGHEAGRHRRKHAIAGDIALEHDCQAAHSAPGIVGSQSRAGPARKS